MTTTLPRTTSRVRTGGPETGGSETGAAGGGRESAGTAKIMEAAGPAENSQLAEDRLIAGNGELTGNGQLAENTTRGTHDVVARWLLAQADVRRILDAPAGEGAFAARCLAAGREVTAGDCEPLCRVPGARFQQLDLNETLPFAEASFDATVCIDGIEHLERPFDFVEQCYRVIRPGGWLVITTPNISSLRSRWRWMLTGFHNKCKSPLDETRPNPLHHVNMLDFPKLRYMLHRHGFVIRHVTTNRYKAAALPYAVWAPLSWCATWMVFRGEEPDPDQRRRNAEILRQLHSPAILLGETMIVMAQRKA